MADEEFDSPDVILDLLGEGQCIADEARQALPQRVVEADLSYRFWIKANNFWRLSEFLPHFVATIKLAYNEIYP